MKIGFLLPSVIAAAGKGNGVRAAARLQAEALAQAGHDIRLLDPWKSTSAECRELDVVHFYVGGFGLHEIDQSIPDDIRFLVMQPIIDSNESNRLYRLAARLGGIHRKIFTVPGELRRQALASDLIVVRSSHEQERIVHGLGIGPGQTPIEIIPHGVDPPRPTSPDLAREKLGIDGDFALHVSSYTQDRKNVIRLIEAIGPLGIPLVIAGTSRPGRVAEKLQELSRRYRVKIFGFLEQPILDSLYAACRIFCLPSIHEGVGLVAMEAASYGAGIVITKNGGPPDYFGDLAQYVDPYNVQQIQLAIQAAWENPQREQLKARMAELSWDRQATRLIEAYERWRNRRRKV